MYVAVLLYCRRGRSADGEKSPLLQIPEKNTKHEEEITETRQINNNHDEIPIGRRAG